MGMKGLAVCRFVYTWKASIFKIIRCRTNLISCLFSSACWRGWSKSMVSILTVLWRPWRSGKPKTDIRSPFSYCSLASYSIPYWKGKLSSTSKLCTKSWVMLKLFLARENRIWVTILKLRTIRSTITCPWNQWISLKIFKLSLVISRTITLRNC